VHHYLLIVGGRISLHATELFQSGAVLEDFRMEEFEIVAAVTIPA
jgi:hypothetical protein